MAKIVGYKLVRSYSPNDNIVTGINNEIEELLLDGYEPYCPPYLVTEHVPVSVGGESSYNRSVAGSTVIIQPMIKYVY